MSKIIDILNIQWKYILYNWTSFHDSTGVSKIPNQHSNLWLPRLVLRQIDFWSAAGPMNKLDITHSNKKPVHNI